MEDNRAKDKDKAALTSLLIATMNHHPRPWTGELVVACPTSDAAEYIVNLAVAFDREMAKIDEISEAIAEETDLVSGPIDWTK